MTRPVAFLIAIAIAANLRGGVVDVCTRNADAPLPRSTG